jgi:hypothetical protein
MWGYTWVPTLLGFLFCECPQPRDLKYWETQIHNVLRASPTVLSIWHQTVKFIAKKSKCAGLAQEIGFSAPNLCSLLWLVKGTTQLCTSSSEDCNELDLTASQYFWLSIITIGPGGLLFSSPHIYAVPLTLSLMGFPKNNR